MKRFATEYVKDGRLYGDVIEAEHIVAAIAIAKFNGLGEIVLGEMVHEEEFDGAFPGFFLPNLDDI